MIGHIMLLDEKQVTETLHEILREFARRHRNITQTFYNCKEIKGLIEELGINYNGLSDERKMLIGSYCTMEYAMNLHLFNPSIVEDFDQSDLEIGEKRIIISFRATGEGHISSIIFRRAILDKNNDLRNENWKNIEKPKIRTLFNKERIVTKLAEMSSSNKYAIELMKDLPEMFEYSALKDR
jgi:hypothetical protein